MTVPGTRYVLERHGAYWRLRKEGNRQGTIRDYREELLEAWARDRGLVVVEADPPLALGSPP